MTRIFVLLYLSVVGVLLVTWYLHREVSQRRARADRARVFEEAHGGGARLMAQELSQQKQAERQQAVVEMQRRFGYPVEIVASSDLSKTARRRLAKRGGVAYDNEVGERVVAQIPGTNQVIRLGPFPNYGRQAVEDSVRGWVRLAAERIGDNQARLDVVRKEFHFPIEVVAVDDLPDWSQQLNPESVVFYRDPATEETRDNDDDKWYAVTAYAGTSEFLRFGPFPSFEKIDQKAATTTLALILVPVALAIALLLRPVAMQLRRVENAAKEIAGGDLSARVDERRVGSAQALAQAFNDMAGQTETMVRTQRELLQAVSHELKTPLARMRFAIELMAAATTEEERQERLDSLDASTDELDQLVGELLGYVRMETVEPNLHSESMDVQLELEQVLPKYASLKPTVDFSLHEIPEGEVLIQADRQMWQRAVGNVIANAGRFAQSQVKIGATINGQFVAIDVDDDGCGIAQSDRERVFEPFVRLEDRGNSERDGVGLGLALVKRIVNEHGGAVEVLDSPMGGCRIRTTWPKGEAAG